MKDFDETTLQSTYSRDYAIAVVSKKLHELRDNQEANAVLVQCIKRAILVDNPKQSYIDFMDNKAILDRHVPLVLLIEAESNYSVCRYFFDCDFLSCDSAARTVELHNV